MFFSAENSTNWSLASFHLVECVFSKCWEITSREFSPEQGHFEEKQDLSKFTFASLDEGRVT